MVCENSELASLDDSTIYRIPDNVREAVLIEGELRCFHTKEIYKSPCVLAKNKKIFK